jgi:hypothetical protein
MKIRDLVYDLVVEAEMTQKRREAIQKDLNLLRDKWGDKFTPEEIEKYYEWFEKTKNNFNTQLPQWRSFLYRFDGQHGFSKFDVANIKEITRYTAQQIKSIYDEYNPVIAGEENNTEVFSSKDRRPTPEKIEASKNLWYGKDNLIYENDGFRVYNITNQQISINYGYYLKTMHEPPYNFGGGQWCTTWWDENNYYPSKRPNRSFYFVIDESKHPDKVKNMDVSKYYLSALQAMKDGSFALTDITNPGEPTYTVDRLLNIYPKLAEVLDKLKFQPYDEESELIIKNVISRINEIPGNRYEYRRLDREFRLQYIAQGGTIQTAESWKATDKQLRNMYIMNTTDRNINDRFSTYELYLELSESDKNSLSRRIGQLFPGKTLSIIVENVMRNEFKVGNVSIDNPEILLYKSVKTQKFGLFHAKHSDWVTHNGVKYGPLYVEHDQTLYVDDEGNSYIVETYTQGGEPDNTSFYSIKPAEIVSDDVPTHFVSAQKFESLKEKIHLSGEGFANVTDFSPEDDVDIKEIKKGL